MSRGVRLAHYEAGAAPWSPPSCHLPPRDLPDGIDFLNRVHDTFPETPVVVMSGGGRSKRLDPLGDAPMLGAVAVLAKPLTIEALLTTVDRALTPHPPSRPKP